LDSYWTSPIEAENLQGFVPLVQTTKDAWTITATPDTRPQSGETNGGEGENITMKFQAIPDPTNFAAFKTANNTKQYTVAGQPFCCIAYKRKIIHCICYSIELVVKQRCISHNNKSCSI
jgi:hypothetical protein